MSTKNKIQNSTFFLDKLENASNETKRARNLPQSTLISNWLDFVWLAPKLARPTHLKYSGGRSNCFCCFFKQNCSKPSSIYYRSRNANRLVNKDTLVIDSAADGQRETNKISSGRKFISRCNTRVPSWNFLKWKRNAIEDFWDTRHLGRKFVMRD